ncbi:ShlB/FhaC/HecB family hemolysin secretion/activation protein [Roseomonas sp. JC162]|uniref:ShlB/FhaC/HecB family hemolysin secretion/activation protein n=1 Tax=Neoroseomonas marina TaxID=1232220 RepID=A0A848E8M3_9PROT|nr:ShlB/FhaC/HecB family hemolysin secretion/activation protein [Neoroseomonas marina]NMJ39927.1 ShlB/FhaC/HecB family hemolysin secretion/activation protein [Neoroseomonas marina]
MTTQATSSTMHNVRLRRLMPTAVAGITVLMGSGLAMAQAPVNIPRPPPAPADLIDRVAPPPAPSVSPRALPPMPQAQRGPGETREVRVSSASVQGNSILSDSEIRRLMAPIEDRTITLARIEETRLTLLGAYRRAGYPFVSIAAALVPGADGRNEVRYAVTEAYVAEVRLDGDIGPAGTQVLRFLERVKESRPVSTRAVERALLLASDVPGVTVRGVLQPIQGEPGALRLIAQVSRSAVSGYFNVDNRAYQLTGPWEALLVAGVNSLTEFGERTEASLYGTEGGTQWFMQASEEFFVGSSGLRIRIYAGMGNTLPSGQLKEIGYEGETSLAGIVANYPIIRSRPVNLWAIGQFDAFNSNIYTGSGSTFGRTLSGRDRIRTVRGGFDAQAIDTLLWFAPPATNQGTVRAHQGVAVWDTTSNNDALASRLGSEFDFTKFTGEYQRVQPIWAPWDGAMFNFQGYVSGQWSTNVLPNAEKYYLGGNRLGRGFYSGQVTGDYGYGYALELQLDIGYELPAEPALGSNRASSQFYLFRDLGWAYQNLDADRDRRLSSWGGGVRTVISEAVQVDLEIARRITTRPDGDLSDPLRATQVYFRTLVRF